MSTDGRVRVTPVRSQGDPTSCSNGHVVGASGGTMKAGRSSVPEPPPIPSDRPAVWDLVIEDMRDRDTVGRERYGTPLQPHNGRDALVDAYQEALDLVVYLRQAILERDA